MKRKPSTNLPISEETFQHLLRLTTEAGSEQRVHETLEQAVDLMDRTRNLMETHKAFILTLSDRDEAALRPLEAFYR